MQCGLPTGSQAGPTVPPAGRLSPDSQVATATLAVHGRLGTWGSGELRPEGHTGAPDPGPGARARKGMPVPTRRAPRVCLLPAAPGHTPTQPPKTHTHAAPRTCPTQPRRHPMQPWGHTPQPQAAPRQAPTKSGGPCSGPAQAMAPAAPHQLLSPRDRGAAGPSPLGPPTPDTGTRALRLRQPRAERELWVAHLSHTGTDRCPRGFFPGPAAWRAGQPRGARAPAWLRSTRHVLGL